jgi:bifunctional DNA primase/polymerase-like protein
MSSLNNDAALHLARASISLFPCELEAKRPCYGVRFTCASVRNEAGVARFWRQFPNARPAINLSGAGLVVIDLDRGHKNGADGVAEFEKIVDAHGEFPNCPAVRTPSGGVHLYFKQPAGVEPIGNSESRIAPGVDVRGHHGFVVAPGAVNADGTFYECIAGAPDLCEAFTAKAIPTIPAWLAKLAEKPAHLTAPPRGPRSLHVGSNRRPLGVAILAGESDALAAAPIGTRNHLLNKSAFIIASKAGAWGWVSEGETWAALFSACIANGYIADDGAKAFERSFYSGWIDGLADPTPPRERLVDDDSEFAARIKNLNAHRRNNQNLQV